MNSIWVQLKDINGNQTSIIIDPLATVEEALALAGIEAFHNCVLRCFFSGKLLDPYLTLQSQGIGNLNTIVYHMQRKKNLGRTQQFLDSLLSRYQPIKKQERIQDPIDQIRLQEMSRLSDYSYRN